ATDRAGQVTDLAEPGTDVVRRGELLQLVAQDLVGDEDALHLAVDHQRQRVVVDLVRVDHALDLAVAALDPLHHLGRWLVLVVRLDELLVLVPGVFPDRAVDASLLTTHDPAHRVHHAGGDRAARAARAAEGFL